MVFVESPAFSKFREAHLDDELFRALQESLLADPESGDPLQHGSGLRKLRFRLKGLGKRGGGRVIYYYYKQVDRIYLIFAYKKSVQSDLSKAQLKQLVEVAREELKRG
jgi:hypothetical protein